MAGQTKLTDEQIRQARLLTEHRREAMREVAKFPTIAQLAERLQCTPRYLQKVIAGKVR